MRNLFALLLTISCCVAAAGDLSPSDVVNRFCKLDSDGARLQSVETDPIWQLTLDNGEPPDKPFVLIDGWKVVGGITNKNDATVIVSYNVIGTIADTGSGPVLHPQNRLDKRTFYLSKLKKGWRIRLDKLGISPHVSTAAYTAHLDELLGLFTSEADKSSKRFHSLETLRNQLQSLAHTTRS